MKKTRTYVRIALANAVDFLVKNNPVEEGANMAKRGRRGNKMQVIAREEQSGDVTVVESGYAEDGSLMVSENVSGPSSNVAYGEPSHRLRVVFPPEVVGALASLLGGGAGAEEIVGHLRSYFQGGEHALIDLMDLCDEKGVSYSYQALGSATGVTYRPAAERL